ncbi:EamA family transporter [Actinoplanes sichuanensis]|uniref:EamA family transporter n=1 Tax=Actinoplanes sichuanensis TaxID=512349 RepID=A0ABW4A6H9_9ACTN|nr:EamA family transporter [Actinoplanes sichuanensis]
MSTALALAGIAAAAWGSADFLAGVGARRLPVRAILIGSELTGLVVAVVYLAVRDGPLPTEPRLLVISAIAGLLAVPAMGLVYRAMRDGSMVVVAPIAAGASLVPVGWGLLQGERLGVGGVVGAIAAMIGMTCVSWPAGPTGRRPARWRAVWCAGGAALCFGTFFVLLHEAAPGDPYIATAYVRVAGGIAGLLLLAEALVTRRIRVRAGIGRRWLLPVVVGVLETVADSTFAVAAAGVAVGAAAVIASLYPAVTVLLNTVVLRERLPAVHVCGVLAALVGVVCLAG